MASAGFYAIHTDELKFASDGRWYADGEPILHERLALLFSRHIRRTADGGYEIHIDDRYHAPVVVEDTPFVVVDVDIEDDAATVVLNDRRRLPLDMDSLAVGAHDVLYCRVDDGREWARFLRPAYNRLAPLIEEAADGAFLLRLGHHTARIGQRS